MGYKVKKGLNVLFAFGLILLFSACGGGGDDGAAENQTDVSSTQKGVFVDSPVDGIEYTSGSQTGVTKDGGKFIYEVGESIAFFIGDIPLGSVPEGKSVVTPLDLANATKDLNNIRVRNVARLLQSLDDGTTKDVISISEFVREKSVKTDLNVSALISLLNAGSDISDGVAENFLASVTDPTVNSTTGSFVSSADAKDHLKISLDERKIEYDDSGTPGDNKNTYTNTRGMSFVLIDSSLKDEPPTFSMGCYEKDSASGHQCGSNEEVPNKSDSPYKVQISQDFYMQKTEVTQGQWRAVTGSNSSSHFSSCGDDCPVESVSWNEIQTFLTTLNALGEGTYRLPTEAEWEYSARADTETAYSSGNDHSSGLDSLSEGCSEDFLGPLRYYGWYWENSSSKPQPVATKCPNPWGLHDMHGNVWEWVQDVYVSDYSSLSGYSSSESVSDPVSVEQGTDTGSGADIFYVARGGSWFHGAYYLRSASRFSFKPDDKQHFLGFRLIVVPPGHEVPLSEVPSGS